MVTIAGTAAGHGDAIALVLVGDEVADWALIEAVRQALPPETRTPFADKIGTLVARREQTIRRAARQRGRKAVHRSVALMSCTLPRRSGALLFVSTQT